MKIRNLKFIFFSFLLTGAVHAATDSRVGPSTALSFDAGKAQLTEDAKTKLNVLIKEARTNGRIDEIRVAAWSDNPVPRTDENLSKPDRELASKRAKAVEGYLKRQHKISDVETHNMAERASILARTFDTADAELKTEVATGSETPITKEEFQVFKTQGQPSKAVILVLLKN